MNGQPSPAETRADGQALGQLIKPDNVNGIVSNAMNRFTVLLGGVRSGKSSLAVDLGRRWDGPVTFAATAEAFDEGMERRIENHQEERPESWAVLEQPKLAAEDLATVPIDHFLIVDCLTVLVSNLLLANDMDDDEILGHVAALATELGRRPAVLVTNEVGMGVHPTTELGRHYRDLLGAANKLVASAAAATYLVVAGRALALADVDQIGALYQPASGAS